MYKIRNIPTNHQLFVDDTSLSYSGKNFDLKQIEINNDLQILDQWAKTKALIISNNTNIPELNIRFNDESVELVDIHKHLGVTFVSDGNWTVHIENIARSALKQVNVLRKLKFIMRPANKVWRNI